VVTAVSPQRRDQQDGERNHHHELEGSDTQLIETERLGSQQIKPVYSGLLDVPEVGIQHGSLLHHPRRQQELRRVPAQRGRQAQQTGN
jgi:hypothetical protein